MSESPEVAREAFEKISHMLRDVVEVPEAFSELVELALEEDVGVEDLETAAQLMAPSDLRAAREFSARLRDGHAGDKVVTEGLDSLDAILAESDAEWEA